MSLDLVKKNSSSPFHLQRSIVDQGGSGGAYESGGFSPDAVYNNDGFNTAIESFSKVVGAALGSRTAEGKNKSNEKKADRLENRAKKTELKKKQALESGNIRKADRMKERGERVEGRLKSTKAEIDTYKKSQNPLAGSDTLKNLDAAMAKNNNSSATSSAGAVDVTKAPENNKKDSDDFITSLKKSLGKSFIKG